MLTELSIRDIALIPRLRIGFRPGLNALSGETGAGKSLIVGSLRVLCGEKVAPDFVRSGADRGIVEGVFEIDPRSWIASGLRELGIELDDGELILRREIAARGKGRSRANGSPISRGTLARATELLLDLHGQHDHQSLLRPSYQLEALDEWAGVREQRDRFGVDLAEWRSAREELDRLREDGREQRERRELARFQLRELDEADVQTGELEALTAERGRLERAELLRGTAAELVERLTEGEGAIQDLLAQAGRSAADAATHDPEWESVVSGLDSSAIGITELAREIRLLGERAVDDPERLQFVRDRHRLVVDLLHKYGPTEEDLQSFRAGLREQAEDPEQRRERLEALQERVSGMSDRLATSGADLREARKAAATRLETEVETCLSDLGMEGTRFRVVMEGRETGHEISPGTMAGRTGLDVVEFRIAPNPGEELRELRAIASGGEISRVMLALKSVMGGVRGTSTSVFDEIDNGVGGRVASRVAAVLASIADERQVICITHLASIASSAAYHLRVSKEERGGRTVSHVEPVEGETRVREVARMLGGEPEEGIAVDHARELLKEMGS